jgi:hypothetical protein
MATKVLTGTITQAEVAKRIDPDGNVGFIAEILERTNQIDLDAHYEEANDQHSHLAQIRVSDGVVSGRKINAGAARSAGVVDQVREPIMLLENFIEIDEQLVDRNANPARLRLTEVQSKLAAFGRTKAEKIIYGNEATDGTDINGLATRYNDLSLVNVVGLGGTGADVTSVWLIEYGISQYYLIYPKNSQAGIEEEDQGKDRVYDADNNPYMAYINQVKVMFGHVVADPRAVQRLANIESAGASNNLVDPNQIRELVYAKSRLPAMGVGAVMYVNRYTKAQVDIWALEKSNGFYMKEDISGEPLAMFQEMPVRMLEALALETAIT